MEGGEAQVRAGYPQLTIKMLEGMDDELYRRFRGKMKKELLSIIESSSRIAWIPVECEVELGLLLNELMGGKRFHLFARQVLGSVMRSPMLSFFVQGALNVMGINPRSLIRWTPKGWEQVFRNCGRLAFKEVSAKESVLEWTEIPQAISNHPVFIEAVGAAFETIYDYCNVEGYVRTDIGPQGGRATLTFKWGF